MNSVKKRRRAVVDPSACVACGCCVKVCPLQAIEIVRGVMAQVRQDKCVGCGKCARECPASVIKIRGGRGMEEALVRLSVDRFALYLLLGFFNILFGLLGLLCFFIPLIISVVSGTKSYCNRYCGRGQLFGLLGGRFGLSARKDQSPNG